MGRFGTLFSLALSTFIPQLLAYLPLMFALLTLLVPWTLTTRISIFIMVKLLFLFTSPNKSNPNTLTYSS